MSYFESKLTGEKEYVFGRGGGEKLAEELNTEVLGQLPWDNRKLTKMILPRPICREDEKLGAIYKSIAEKVIQKTAL